MTDRYLVQEDDEGAMARMAFADAMREGRPVHRALSQQAKDGTVRPTCNHSVSRARHVD